MHITSFTVHDLSVQNEALSSLGCIRKLPEGLAEEGVINALTNERVYKKAYSPDTAYEMILNGECGQFNPRLIRCFVECHGEFEAQAAENLRAHAD